MAQRLDSHLDEHEIAMQRTEARVASFRGTVERYIEAIRLHPLAEVEEEDFPLAYRQLVEFEKQLRINVRLAELRSLRARVAKGKSLPQKARALQLYDREEKALRAASSILAWARGEMENLRDAFLIRETQEFSAHGGFWSDD
ncbi:MAG TPA: hypothetical protein VF756_22990 [Thermoanaerobaculia bacterium]